MSNEDGGDDGFATDISSPDTLSELGDLTGAHIQNNENLRYGLGLSKIAEGRHSCQLLFSAVGRPVRNDLNAASLVEACKTDIEVAQPQTNQQILPRRTVRHISLAVLLTDDTSLQHCEDPGTSPAWWEILLQHEDQYLLSQNCRNNIIDLAKSLLTTEESKSKFLKTFEDPQTGSKKSKKKSKKKRESEEDVDSKTLPERPTEELLSDTSTGEHLQSTAEWTHADNSLQHVILSDLATTSSALHKAVTLNETPQWQKSVLSKDEQLLRRTIMSIPQVPQNRDSLNPKSKDLEGSNEEQNSASTVESEIQGRKSFSVEPDVAVEKEVTEASSTKYLPQADHFIDKWDYEATGVLADQKDVGFVEVKRKIIQTRSETAADSSSKVDAKPPTRRRVKETALNDTPNTRRVKPYSSAKTSSAKLRQTGRLCQTGRQSPVGKVPGSSPGHRLPEVDVSTSSGSNPSRGEKSLKFLPREKRTSVQDPLTCTRNNGSVKPVKPVIAKGLKPVTLADAQIISVVARQQSLYTESRSNSSEIENDGIVRQSKIANTTPSSVSSGKWSYTLSAEGFPGKCTQEQTQPDNLGTTLISDFSCGEQINAFIPSNNPRMEQATLPFPPLDDTLGRTDTRDLSSSPSSESSREWNEESPKFYDLKDPKKVRRRRHTIPDLIVQGLIRVRNSRADTLPPYDLGDPKFAPHHRKVHNTNRMMDLFGQALTSLRDTVYKCAYQPCGLELRYRQAGSVYCHICGWSSRTVYCSNAHRLFDSERHYFNCAAHSFVPIAAVYEPFAYSPPIYNIIGFNNSIRARQMIHFMHNPHGRYALFLDPRIAARYQIPSPVFLDWTNHSGNGRFAPAGIVQEVLAICFENHMLQFVVLLAYIFVRTAIEHTFNPVPDEMISQLNGQFAMEFAFNVPVGWPWGLYPILWRGWRYIWRHLRPHMQASPYPYSLRLSKIERHWGQIEHDRLY